MINTTSELVICAEEAALEPEPTTEPTIDLTMADHFALHALGIDWDALDTRDAQQ